MKHANLRAHILKTVAQFPSATRRENRQRLLATHLSAVIFLGGSTLLPGGMNTLAAHAGYELWLPLGMACLAVATSSAWTLWKSQSEFGLARRSLFGTVATTLGVWLLSVWANPVSLFSLPSAATSPAASSAFGCLLFSVAVGGGVLALVSRGQRRSDLNHPGATGLAVGAMVASWVGLVLAMRCPNHQAAHLLGAHIAPAVVLVTISGGLRVLAIRRKLSAQVPRPA